MAMVASPSAATPAPTATVSPPSCPQPPQFHVLAVDDSVLDRKLIESLLRTSSYHVTAVDSVTKALEFLGMHHGGPPPPPPLAPSVAHSSCCISSSSTSAPSSYCTRHHHQKQDINLIITDYCMPGMTGYDLLKTVKRPGSPLRDIPVVIMSSENVPARINRCLEEGADEFLLKPVKLSDMCKLRPRVLGEKPHETAADDKEEDETRGVFPQPAQQVQQHPMELQHCGAGDDVAVVVDADVAAADSPRSNKRKAAQRQQSGAGQDHRARPGSSRSSCPPASIFLL